MVYKLYYADGTASMGVRVLLEEIGDDVREAQLGSTQKLVLELIRESPRCTQKYLVGTIGKDQGQVAKAIDRLVEVGLVIKKEKTLMAL